MSPCSVRSRPTGDDATSPPCAPRCQRSPAAGSRCAAPSATTESISTPRLIGPGCITMHRAWPAAGVSSVRPKILKYSPALGSSAPLMRSFCRRSMITTSASLDAFAHVVADPARPCSAARPAPASSGPTTRISGTPSVVSAWMSERATRECSDVADDGHRQVGEVLLVVADGVHVEQALGRVRMAAVAGVDDMDMAARSAARSGRARPTRCGAPRTCRHAIALRLAMVSSRRLALGGRSWRDVEVEHVGRQALGRDLEGGAGARAVLEEQVEHALAAQQRHLLDLAVVDR